MRSTEALLPLQSHQFVSLQPMIDALTHGEYTWVVSNDELAQLTKAKLSSEQAYEVWESIKAEKNALIAIFVHHIWNHPDFTHERAQGNIPKDRTWFESAAFLSSSFRRFTREFCEVNTARVAAGATVRLSEQFSHFMAITAFERAHLDKQKYRDKQKVPTTPEVHLNSGIGTSFEVNTNVVARFADAAAQIHLSPQEFREGLWRSIKHFNILLASDNQQRTIALTRALQQRDGENKPISEASIPQWEESFFTLEVRGEPPERAVRLALNPDSYEEITTRAGDSWQALFGDTTRCPVMYRVNGEQPVVLGFSMWMQDQGMRYFRPTKKA